jgi:glutathione S-transferase
MTVAPLVLTRQFKAPPARVFAAFIEKGLMQGWYGPEGMTIPHCDVDPRVGGKYRIEMHAPSGDVNVVTGEFKEIKTPERLVFSWGWLNGAGRNPETIVTLTFKECDGGTELTLEQTGFLKEEFRKGHSEGWTSSWNALEAMLGGRPKPQTATPTVMGDGRSPCTQAVRIAFFEKGVAHAHQPLAPQSPEILAQNPFGKIPVLRAGDLSLFESSAILHYVNEVYPGPALMPEAPADRARAEQWISAIVCYSYPAIIKNYVLQHVFPRGADGRPDRAVIEAAIPEIRKVLAALDAAYGQKDALAGDALSLPDILLAPQVSYLQRFPEGKDLVAMHPNVRRAHKAFAARPSFAEATQPATA